MGGPQRREPGHRRAESKRSAGRAVVPFLAVLVLVSGALWVAWGSDFGNSDEALNLAAGQSALVEAELTPVPKPKKTEAKKTEPEKSEPEKAEEPASAAVAPPLFDTTTPPPANSGSGKRIVFHQTAQRVWLINADESIDRTFLVSGSRFDNLKPGNYSVMAHIRHVTAFDYSGTMEYFLRFATGFSEPIGFHAIPVFNDGTPEQTEAELGTRLSAGCVRMAMDNAKYMWDWAPDGTPVTVVP